MLKSTVLIVDDEPQIRKVLRIFLDEYDYKIEESESGKQAIRMAASVKPDLILLDLGLPDCDGKDVIAAVREWSLVPIVVLSARNADDEIAQALDAGADDYVTKPFSVDVLAARIRANLRRTTIRDAGEPEIHNGNVRVDLIRHEVFVNNNPVNLTPREYELLRYFISHRGRILTHRQILKDIWGEAHVDDTQYLRVYVGQLREKIEPGETERKLISTVPGVGYRMEILDEDGQQKNAGKNEKKDEAMPEAAAA
jgi:two-component system KDP operon response regulator KdpE